MDAYVDELLAGIKRPTRALPPPRTELKWNETKAFSYNLRAWKMQVPKGHPSERDLMAFLKSAQPYIKRKLVQELLVPRRVKFQLALEVVKDKGNGTEVLQAPVFLTKQITLQKEHEILHALHEAFPLILEGLEKF